MSTNDLTKEGPEFVLARYKADVLAYLSSARVEPDRIDHKLINESIVSIVHNGAERVYGKDVVMATAVAETMIEFLLSGVKGGNVTPERKARIINESVADATRWATRYYATKYLWCFRKPLRPRWLLETIVRSEVSLRS